MSISWWEVQSCDINLVRPWSEDSVTLCSLLRYLTSRNYEIINLCYLKSQSLWVIQHYEINTVRNLICAIPFYIEDSSLGLPNKLSVLMVMFYFCRGHLDLILSGSRQWYCLGPLRGRLRWHFIWTTNVWMWVVTPCLSGFLLTKLRGCFSLECQLRDWCFPTLSLGWAAGVSALHLCAHCPRGGSSECSHLGKILSFAFFSSKGQTFEVQVHHE